MQATSSEAESKGEWVAAWVGAALLFGVGIWQTLGAEKAEEFFAGYLLEQSLSVDNLFVFILVFRYFRAPKADQDKVKVHIAVGVQTSYLIKHGAFLPAAYNITCTHLFMSPESIDTWGFVCVMGV